MTDRRHRTRTRAGSGARSHRPLNDERRVERREELLTAALAAVRRHGPAASMDQIAAEAGITKPILYRYFGDRDGLLAAVADRFADTLVSRLETALAEEGPRRQLEAAFNSYVEFIEEDPGLYTFLTTHETVRSPALLGVIDRVAATAARAIGESLRQQGADSGAAETWAYGIVGMVHMAGARWVARPTIPRERLVAYLVTLIWEGSHRFLAVGSGREASPGGAVH